MKRIVYGELTALVFCLLVVGCATVHPGKLSEVLEDDPSIELEVSGRTIGGYSDKYHQFIELTLKNHKGDWVKVAKAEVQYGEGNLKHSFPVGKGLTDWVAATDARLKMENYNRSMTFAAFAVAGAAVAAGSKSRSSQQAGAIASAAGIGALAGQSAVATHGKAQNVTTVPQQHIYAPFSVPAGMFLRRWILVHVPGDKWSSGIYLTLHTVDGKKEKYLVNLLNE